MTILNMVTKGSGGGGNIGEPLNLTVTTSGLDATITWTDNEIGTIPPTTFAKSELVRKVGSAPTSPSDGTLVVTETVKDTYKVSGYVDQGLTDGTTYYYRVFSYSDLGGISYCDAVSITINNSRDFSQRDLLQTSSSLSGPWWGGVFFNPDGTKIFITSYSNGGKVYESSLLTAYDLSNIDFTKTITKAAAEDIHFNSDGTSMYVLANGEINQYTLPTAWDITDANLITTKSGTASDRGLYITPDGGTLYVSTASGGLRRATMSTARNLSTLSSFTDISYSLGGISIWFGKDGYILMNMTEGSSNLNYHILSSAYDVTSITSSGTLNVGENRAGGLWADNGGQICVMVGGGGSTNYVTKYKI